MFNIALAGSGVFAQASYLPALASSTDTIRLHTIWSRSESSTSKLLDAAKTTGLADNAASIKVLNGDAGLERLLSDPEIDGVAFVLPISAQPELVVRALQAGKHVISEKPVGKDVATAKAFIERYEKEFKPKGLIWRVAENFNHDQGIRNARDLIRNEKLGPVLYWQLQMQAYLQDGSKYQATQWRTIPDYQGGFLLDGGVHFVAMVRNIVPSPPNRVVAYSSLHRAHIPPHDTLIGIARASDSTLTSPHGPETQLKTLLTTADMPTEPGQSSAQGTVLISFAAPDLAPEHRTPVTLRVTCLNAVLQISGSSAGWKVEIMPGAGSDIQAYSQESKGNGVQVELQEWAEAIAAHKAGKKSEKRNDGDPKWALWDVAFIEALLTSEGNEVSIEDLIA